MTEPARKPGNARFATYYKVQYWNARNPAWADIQRSYATQAEARGAYPAGRRCRLMKVTPKGRQPVA